MAEEVNDRAKTLSNRLFEAISKDNIEEVRICISQGVDLKLLKAFDSQVYRYDNHVCPLTHSCCLGREEIMKELLKAGAEPNQVSGIWHHWPVLIMAAYKGSLTLSMMKTLMSYGADVCLRDESGNTILHILTRIQLNDTSDNQLSAAKLLLDRGLSFYAKAIISLTPLYQACYSGNVDLVKLFIAEGADVNYDNDNKDRSMLIAAAKISNIKMFDLLIASGANRCLNSDALVEPCFQNDCSMIARILDTCGVDIHTATDAKTGMTILHDACDNPRVRSETVKMLLDHGADVKVVSATGDTALHYTMHYCDCSKIHELLAYNHPLNIKNKKKQTPLLKLIGFSPRYPQCLDAAWFRIKVLAFKMLVGSGADFTPAVDHELNDLCTKYPETQLSDYEINSTKSLQEMCRLAIRGTILVPIDGSAFKLPIPKRLQEYLTFPEFIPLVDEYLDITSVELVT